MTASREEGADRPRAPVQLGRWTLQTRLGSGAFGTTWRATRDDGTVAAVKRLSEAPAGELRTLAHLVHPAIPGLLEASEQEPWFLAMELASGQPLSAVFLHGTPNRARFLRGVVGLFDALAVVHAAGLRHGDVKPENIIWDDHASIPAQLIDFGLSDAAGGTPLWSAPEQLDGAPGTASVDVYAMGLVAWRGLYGTLPWGHLSSGEALARRAREVPPPPVGEPDWMDALLMRILTPDPGLRPTASDVVDGMAAHGVQPPPIDHDVLVRRARAVGTSHRSVDSAVATWLKRGGVLAVHGPLGCGRRRLAGRVVAELGAAGRSCLRLWPASEEWGSVEAGLAARGVQLPEAPDHATRVEKVAELVQQSEMAVVVQSYEALDPRSCAVLDRLVELRAPVFLTAAHRPAGARTSVAVEPLDSLQIGGLIAALLGDGADQPAVRRLVWRVTRGLAGDVVRFLVACVESGALQRRRGIWELDENRTPELPPRTELRGSIQPGSFPYRVVSTLAWLRRPLSPPHLADILDASVFDVDEAISGLSAIGWVVRDEGCVDLREGLGAWLRDLDGERGFDIPRARRWFQRVFPADDTTHLWLALADGDTAAVRALGSSVVRWWIPRNPGRAAQIAETLATAVDDCGILEARMQALVAAGMVAAARSVGEEALAAVPEDHQDNDIVGALVVMGALANNHNGQPDEALAWCGRARRALPDGREAPPELILTEAKAHSLIGDLDQALARTMAMVRGLTPTTPAEARIWLRASTIAAQSLHQQGNLSDAIDLLASIDDTLGLGLAERAVAHAALGRLYWFAGQFHAADAAMSKAGESDTGLGMLDRARLLNNLGAVRHHSGNRSEAVSAWEQAFVLFQRVESEVEAVRTRANLCIGYKELGRFERARQAGVWAAAEAERLGMDDLQCHASLNLGELYMCQQRYDDAAACFDEAAARATAAVLDRERIEAGLRRVELGLRRGDPGLYREAESIRQDADAASMLVEACQASALSATALARQDSSHPDLDGLIDAAIRPLQRAGAAAELARVRLWVGEALLAADRPKDAATEVDRGRAYARERGNVPLLQWSEDLEARLAARWDDPQHDIRLAKLVSVAVTINEQDDLNAVFEHIARAGREILDGDRAFVLTGDPPGVVAAVSRGVVQGRPSMSVVHQAIRDRREVIAADVDERGDLRELRSVAAMELRSVVCVPMHHNDETIGAIYVDSRSANHRRLWESAELMRGLAAMAAVAVAKMRYFEDAMRQATTAAKLAEREKVALELSAKNEELERLNRQLQASAVTDPLTGIGNRRHMAEVLSRAFEVACGGGPTMSVVIADIDHFKRVNDTWGHQVGDFVIREVAGRLQSQLRGEDRVFRYGGEEMVVLTYASSPQELRALCERLRVAVSGEAMPLGDEREGTITTSLGAAWMRPSTDNRWEEILQRADAALYAAKAGGRNQTVLAADLALDDIADAGVA